jgi:hypothetical protein
MNILARKTPAPKLGPNLLDAQIAREQAAVSEAEAAKSHLAAAQNATKASDLANNQAKAIAEAYSILSQAQVV